MIVKSILCACGRQRRHWPAQMVGDSTGEDGWISQSLTPRSTAESRYGIGVRTFGAWISAIVRSYMIRKHCAATRRSQEHAAQREGHCGPWPRASQNPRVVLV